MSAPPLPRSGDEGIHAVSTPEGVYGLCGERARVFLGRNEMNRKAQSSTQMFPAGRSGVTPQNVGGGGRGGARGGPRPAGTRGPCGKRRWLLEGQSVLHPAGPGGSAPARA